MNNTELLNRINAPVTRTYNQSQLPPSSGLEAVGISIDNDSDTTFVCRIIKADNSELTLRIPAKTAYDNYLPLYKGVIVDVGLTFEMHIKELDRTRGY